MTSLFNVSMDNTVFLIALWISSLTLTFTVIGVTTTSQDPGEVQEVIYNLYLTGEGSKTSTLHTGSFAKCATICNYDRKCSSVSYNMAEGACHLNQVSLTKGKIVARYDTQYKYMHITKRNSFQLVFRATEGIGTSVYDAWNNVGHHDDVTSVTANEFGCLTLDYRYPCPKHFRSKKLDDFSNISKVRFAFYTMNRKDILVDFKAGSKTSATESFDMAKVVEPGEDKPPSGFVGPYNYDSVEGYPSCLRRFYISQNHSTATPCSEDTGWMFVSDGWAGGDCCSYEDSGPYPMFLYSKYGDPVNWNNGTAAKKSKVFAVFFKYKNK